MHDKKAGPIHSLHVITDDGKHHVLRANQNQLLETQRPHGSFMEGVDHVLAHPGTGPSSSKAPTASAVAPDFHWPSDGTPTPERLLGHRMRADATDASARAQVATTKALHDKTAESHRAAASAHDKAAGLLSRVPGYKDLIAQHRDSATFHRNRAGIDNGTS